MIRSIATALALLASPAAACDAYVLHLASYHSDRTLIPDVNERNIGLGCRIGSFESGFFHNSYSDVTAYALGDWTHSSGLGVFAGVASGYQDDAGVADHDFTVIGGGVYRGEHVTFRAAPSVAKATGAKGVVVSLSISFGGA